MPQINLITTTGSINLEASRCLQVYLLRQLSERGLGAKKLHKLLLKFPEFKFLSVFITIFLLEKIT